MPTDSARAALRFLLARNEFYMVFHREQKRRLDSNVSLNLSSHDLFIVQSGIECATYPLGGTDAATPGKLLSSPHVLAS